MPLHLVPSTDTALLVSLLEEADEGLERIRQAVEDSAHTAYTITHHHTIIGAALMRWHPAESEIIYIAINASQRGHGYGKQAVALIIAEARQRGAASVLVGTANASLENIAFYQKCGFRMDSVRKDYFDYFPAPISENGIRIQDMIVFRYNMVD